MKRLFRIVFLISGLLIQNSIYAVPSTDKVELLKNYLREDGEIIEKQENSSELDSKTAKQIIDHFSNPRSRWENLIKKVNTGDTGTINLVLQLLKYSEGEKREQLHLAVQEAMIDEPDKVLREALRTNTELSWLCGKPAKKNYDIAAYLNESRYGSIEMMLELHKSGQKTFETDVLRSSERCLSQLGKELDIELKEGNSARPVPKKREVE